MAGRRAKVLVVRGSPVHYLLVRANRYDGPVGLVDNVDDAVSQLLQPSVDSGRHDDHDDDDVILLTDAAVADYTARQVRNLYTTTLHLSNNIRFLNISSRHLILLLIASSRSSSIQAASKL